jgi:hypothetical protein
MELVSVLQSENTYERCTITSFMFEVNIKANINQLTCFNKPVLQTFNNFSVKRCILLFKILSNRVVYNTFTVMHGPLIGLTTQCILNVHRCYFSYQPPKTYSHVKILFFFPFYFKFLVLWKWRILNFKLLPIIAFRHGIQNVDKHATYFRKCITYFISFSLTFLSS